MKTRKIVSLLMAIVMVLAVAMPAFASDPAPNVTDPAKMATGITTKLTGKTTAGEISIVVPTTGTVVVNPYGLKIDATTGEADDTNGVEVQVASAWQAIENKSATTDVDVTATVTGTVAGNAKLSAATDKPTYAADGTIKTNEIWAYLETTVGSSATTTAPAAPGATVSFDADASGYTSNILIGTKGTAAKVGKIVKAASGSNSFLNFHVNGLANKFSTNPWTTKDTLSVSIVFTFAPAVA